MGKDTDREVERARGNPVTYSHSFQIATEEETATLRDTHRSSISLIVAVVTSQL